jgi:hypothetical protein
VSLVYSPVAASDLQGEKRQHHPEDPNDVSFAEAGIQIVENDPADRNHEQYHDSQNGEGRLRTPAPVKGYSDEENPVDPTADQYSRVFEGLPLNYAAAARCVVDPGKDQRQIGARVSAKRYIFRNIDDYGFQKEAAKIEKKANEDDMVLLQDRNPTSAAGRATRRLAT